MPWIIESTPVGLWAVSNKMPLQQDIGERFHVTDALGSSWDFETLEMRTSITGRVRQTDVRSRASFFPETWARLGRFISWTSTPSSPSLGSVCVYT